MRPRRFSIAWQTDKPLSAYGPLAAQAEAYGFNTVAVYNDLFFQPAWYPLLQMARHTTRVTLGPAAVNPFTTHPIHIAGQLSLLHQAAPGRVYLGLARGAWLEGLGIQPDSPTRALAEAFAAIRHLLRREPSALPAEYFPLKAGEMLRWPMTAGEDAIPFLLGSWGERTIAACLSQVREVKLGGVAAPDVVAHYRRLLPAEVELVVGAVTVVDHDAALARAQARREAALYLPVVAKLDPIASADQALAQTIRRASEGIRQGCDDVALPDALLTRYAFVGAPTDIITQAASVVEAGAARVEFGTPHGLTPAAGLKLLGEEVLPALRSHS